MMVGGGTRALWEMIGVGGWMDGCMGGKLHMQDVGHFLDRSPGGILLELLRVRSRRSGSHVQLVLLVSDLAISSVTCYLLLVIRRLLEETVVGRQHNLAGRD